MKEIEVREKIFSLLIGIISFLFSLFCLFFSLKSAVSNHDISLLLISIFIFGGFFLISVFLILMYFRRKIVFSFHEIKYIPSVGEIKVYNFTDILKVVVKNERYIVYDYENRKMFSFENNMKNSWDAIEFLKSREIVFEYPILERTKKNNEKVEQEEKRNISYIKAHWDLKVIRKQEMIIRILSFSFLIILLSSIFFFKKYMIHISLFIFIFHEILFLVLYPKYNVIRKSKYAIKSWNLDNALATLVLLIFSFKLNIDYIDAVVFMLVYTVILFIVIFTYFTKIKHVSLKTSLSMIILCFSISFFTSVPFNYICTLKEPICENTIIADMKTENGIYISNHYVTVNIDGKNKNIEISEKLYEKLEVEDIIQIYKKESIFGVTYYTYYE